MTPSKRFPRGHRLWTSDHAEEARQRAGRQERVLAGLPVWREYDPTLDELPHHLSRDWRVLTPRSSSNCKSCRSLNAVIR
jgi:hypothetical protein